jgi:hypothetical protein
MVIFKYPMKSIKTLEDQHQANNNETMQALQVADAPVKFKPKNHFNNKLTSSSLNQFDTEISSDIDSERQNYYTKSLENLNENNELSKNQGIFLTESKALNNQNRTKQANAENKKKITPLSSASLNNLSIEIEKSKEEEKQKWDYHLIDMLSENTARWIVMKNTSDRKCSKYNFNKNNLKI